MNEVELKFQIPADQLAAVRQRITELAQSTGQAPSTLPLHAAYFDTPEHALAQRKCALRVRSEGAHWVQTFKGAGADAMTRLEENIDVPTPANGQPRPDLACHSADVQSALSLALNWVPGTDPHGHALGLHALYETRFERLHANQASAQGAALVCLDEGQIKAGHLQSPIAELELELMTGSPLALIEIAQSWVAQHGVWLDVQSKAMKGTRLAQAAASNRPSTAQALHLPRDWLQSTPSLGDPAWRQGLSQCLDVAAGNGAEVAFGHAGWDAAFEAWRQSMIALQVAAKAHPAHAASMGEAFWLQHGQVLQTLQNTPADLPSAQDIATSRAPSLWALQLLRYLNTAQ